MLRRHLYCPGKRARLLTTRNSDRLNDTQRQGFSAATGGCGEYFFEQLGEPGRRGDVLCDGLD